jgi:hypothetical protein
MHNTNHIWVTSDLNAGTMVCDTASGDVGVLMRRYDIMATWESEEPIWAWDMLWSGPATDQLNRHTPYTEFGVLGLLNSGRWYFVEAS